MQIAAGASAGRPGVRGAGWGRPGDLRRPGRAHSGRAAQGGPLRRAAPAGPAPASASRAAAGQGAASLPPGVGEGRPDQDPRFPATTPRLHTGGFPPGSRRPLHFYITIELAGRAVRPGPASIRRPARRPGCAQLGASRSYLRAALGLRHGPRGAPSPTRSQGVSAGMFARPLPSPGRHRSRIPSSVQQAVAPGPALPSPRGPRGGTRKRGGGSRGARRWTGEGAAERGEGGGRADAGSAPLTCRLSTVANRQPWLGPRRVQGLGRSSSARG